MAKTTGAVNGVTVHAGALKQAIWLLRWWADDGSDAPEIVEMMRQSKEAARDLERDLQRQSVKAKQ
jgi:hypothetical protein